MSIVGPRPLAVQYLGYYNEIESRRHLVLPGLTGLAQINGRNCINWPERFAYDVKYVENVSFLFDVSIILKTIVKVLKRSDVAVRATIIMINRMQCAPEKVKGEDGLPIPPYRVYNIGNNSPENLLDFVDILQQELIRAGVLPEDYDFEAHKKLVPMQPGDVPVTYADTSALERDFGFKPSTSLREGLRRFAEWYKEFYL